MDQHETLHAYLKESSMARHQRTESTMGGIGLSTLPGYISFLRVQAAGVNALEQALTAFKPEFERMGIGWADRAPALAADLQALQSTWDPMPPPALSGFEQALGAAYTLEGSRLGNAMLGRQMKSEHPGLADKASAFLSFPTMPGFWRAFTDHLNSAVPDRSRWPAVLEGSVIAFDAFQHSAERELAHLSKIGHQKQI